MRVTVSYIRLQTQHVPQLLRAVTVNSRHDRCGCLAERIAAVNLRSHVIDDPVTSDRRYNLLAVDAHLPARHFVRPDDYRGADKSLARPGRK